MYFFFSLPSCSSRLRGSFSTNSSGGKGVNREELEYLERQEMSIHDQQGAILKAIQEGREEGRQEGIRKQAIAIARQLLERLDDETISQTTGLSLEEVQRLRSTGS